MNHIIRNLIFILMYITPSQYLSCMTYQQQDAAQPALDDLLYTAIQQHNSTAITELINHKADPNGFKVRHRHKYFTPLQYAVLYENITIIHLLVDKGALTDYKNRYGTALDVALNKYRFHMDELADAVMNPSCCICYRQTIADEIQEHIDALKVIITFLGNCTTEATSKERAQTIFYITLDRIIEQKKLSALIGM